ncbi:MAG TPA: acyl-CoA dehydratase activase [Bacillota bacterium]|nr:acyl-CoA dehydratase activase [Bacillota bacterium]
MNKKNYVLGVDVGSTASKCVVFCGGKHISSSVVSAGTGTSGPQKAIEQALGGAGISKEDIVRTVATGYGRNRMTDADETKSELSCHAKGAFYLFPQVRTVIDIGGQDAKVLKITPQGTLSSFVMNDKCAAGTGRFLDVMARILELDIGDLAGVGDRSAHRVDISSTCTVFAESEVISQLANGEEICDVVAGIHRSVASRVSGLAKRAGVEDQVVMTGGVSRNYGVVKALEEELGVKIYTSPESQLAGAIGAALYAEESLDDGAESIDLK